MRADLQASFNFADLQGLGALRREAQADTPEARRVVAQQFEALFLNQLMKQMRDASAVVDGGLFDRERMRFHEDMLDQQMALSLSRGRGIGLADAILRQLGGDGGEPLRPVSAPGPFMGPPGVAAEPAARSALKPGSIREPVGPAKGGAMPGPRAVGRDFRPETPEAFVAELWPHAQRAAKRLGVPAEVLVAQAALETGWGRHMIRDASGAPSFNLFGVKATGGWQGRQASVSTLEFVNGVPERRREPFRVYSGLAESFADYVRLIESRPRYAAARAATNAADYARALQAGGYATDPDYASKIIAIVERGLPGRSQTASAPQRDQVHSAAADTHTPGPVASIRAAAGDEA